MFFQRQYEDRITTYDGNSDTLEHNNSKERQRWCIAPRRTLMWVLNYIAEGNAPAADAATVVATPARLGEVDGAAPDVVVFLTLLLFHG
jgi:hypothetical protein